MNDAALTCERAREAAPEFVLGTLDGHQRASLVEHVAGCARCRTEVSSLNAAVNDLALLAPELTPSPGFEERVLRAVTVAQGEHARPVESQTPVVEWATPLVGGAPATAGRVIISRRLRAFAAAALVVVALVFGLWRLAGSGGSATVTRQMSSPMISAQGRSIGQSVLTRGSSDVITVTVSYPFPGVTYGLEGVGESGRVVVFGPMHVVDGAWKWSGPLTAADADVRLLRVVTPSGLVVCQGQFPR